MNKRGATTKAAAADQARARPKVLREEVLKVHFTGMRGDRDGSNKEIRFLSWPRPRAPCTIQRRKPDNARVVLTRGAPCGVPRIITPATF